MSLTPNMEMNCSKAELAAKVVKSDTGQAVRDVVSSLRWHADELAKLRAELEEAKRLHEHVNDLLANEIELGGRTAEELGREREARKRAEAERLQALTDMHHACDRADRAEACALSVEVLEQLADMCEHASVHCVDDDDSAVATELLVNVKASLSAARSGGLGQSGTDAKERLREAVHTIGVLRELSTLLRDQLRNALGQPECPDDKLVEAVGAMFVELANMRGDNDELDRLAEAAREERDAARSANTPLHLEVERLREELEKARGLLEVAERQRDESRGQLNAVQAKVYDLWLAVSAAEKARRER